ncbi:hypothetical protein ACLB2K_035901 [Fragaria x ananassa]
MDQPQQNLAQHQQEEESSQQEEQEEEEGESEPEAEADTDQEEEALPSDEPPPPPSTQTDDPPVPDPPFDPSRMIGIIRRKSLIKELAAMYHAECMPFILSRAFAASTKRG